MHTESIRAKVRQASLGDSSSPSCLWAIRPCSFMGSGSCQEPGRYFECQNRPVVRHAGRKKGVTRSRVVERDNRQDGRERGREKKNERMEERIGRTGYRRGEGTYSYICSRGMREINGSRNRQKPVRGQKTCCRHRLNCRRAIRGEKREEEKKKTKKKSYRDARGWEWRKGWLRRKKRNLIPMEEAGNLPPALKPVLRDLKFATKFYIL